MPSAPTRPQTPRMNSAPRLRAPSLLAPVAALLLSWLLASTAETSTTASAAHRGAEVWPSPLPGPFRVTGPYRAPPTPYASGHRGIDLPAIPGAPVRAPVAGTVAFSGVVVDRPALSIRVDERTVLSIEPVASTLAPGATVTTGDEIGVVARGGHCADECLHIGVRVDGDYANPLRFFVSKPRLLPWSDASAPSARSAASAEASAESGASARMGWAVHARGWACR